MGTDKNFSMRKNLAYVPNSKPKHPYLLVRSRLCSNSVLLILGTEIGKLAEAHVKDLAENENTTRKHASHTDSVDEEAYTESVNEGVTEPIDAPNSLRTTL